VEVYSAARQVTDNNKIRQTRFACWVPKATSTHSEYVVFIAFPFQQWLGKRASMLRLFILCLCLTAIGLTPGGSSTVHIYTQTVHKIKSMEHTQKNK
jgi:hypothetical protein